MRLCAWCGERAAVALAELPVVAEATAVCAGCAGRAQRGNDGAYPTVWGAEVEIAEPPAVLFHGTSLRRADRIAVEGIAGRQADNRVFMTSSLDVAVRYAEWRAMADVLAPPEPLRSPLGRQAATLGGHVGCVLRLRVGPVRREVNSYPPVLPWSTTRPRGDAWYHEGSIPAAAIENVEAWRVEALNDAERRMSFIGEWLVRCRLALDMTPNIGGTRGAAFRGPMVEAIPSITALLVAAHRRPGSRVHGAAHALGVAAAAIRIIEGGCPADVPVLMAFAVLHDAARVHDGPDPEHGRRAVEVAERMTRSGLLCLSDEQRELLVAALIDHDRGLTSDVPTIGACWDADRLTLPRVGITPDARRLSTPQGRRLSADLDHIPTPADCDWSWLANRAAMLAIPAREVRYLGAEAPALPCS